MNLKALKTNHKCMPPLQYLGPKIVLLNFVAYLFVLISKLRQLHLSATVTISSEVFRYNLKRVLVTSLYIARMIRP